MSGPTFSRLQEIFFRATELEDPARSSFLAQQAREWPDLVDKVHDLLRADESLREARTVRPARPIMGGERLGTGQRIGPFLIRELLGRGCHGVVYLAERASGDTEQRVAIKVLRGAQPDPAGSRRFQSASRLLARLQHPGIARLIDCGETAFGAPYLATEYVPGSSISRHCGRRRLDVPARVELIVQVCDAVGFAHRHRVVHHGLKPENVRVTDEGRVKLVDFRSVEASSWGRGRGFASSYAAPEQIAGAATTVQTDIYRLGVVLYELLTGTRPCKASGKTPREVAEAILYQRPLKPSRRAAAATDPAARARGSATAGHLRRRLRGDLDRIVMRCLRKSPAARYPTVEDLAADLERFLADREGR